MDKIDRLRSDLAMYIQMMTVHKPKCVDNNCKRCKYIERNIKKIEKELANVQTT